jgi:arginase
MKTRNGWRIAARRPRFKKICVVDVPYDLGRTRFRMANGPAAYLRAGLLQRIAALGHDVRRQRVRIPLSSLNEIQAGFETARVLAQSVRQAVRRREFPLILAGNCMNAAGVLGGLEGSAEGVVWFDAHGDFNDPETTETGFVDGMALSVATGRCWRTLTASIPGFRPLPGSSVLLLGPRSIDAGERTALAASRATVLPWSESRHDGFPAPMASAIRAFSRCVTRVYLHVDMDVLDPREAPANEFAPPGGFRIADLVEAVTLVCNHLSVRAATFSGYSPHRDPARRTVRAGLAVIQAVVAATVSRQPVSQ